jgi:hypothetical protein
MNNHDYVWSNKYAYYCCGVYWHLVYNSVFWESRRGRKLWCDLNFQDQSPSRQTLVTQFIIKNEEWCNLIKACESSGRGLSVTNTLLSWKGAIEPWHSQVWWQWRSHEDFCHNFYIVPFDVNIRVRPIIVLKQLQIGKSCLSVEKMCIYYLAWISTPNL